MSDHVDARTRLLPVVRIAVAGVSAALLLAGCNTTSESRTSHLDISESSHLLSSALMEPTNPLARATTHWAEAFEKDPKSPVTAINYARNLRALGSNEKALEVMKRSYAYNPKNPDVASEYGRLALASGETHLADQLLRQVEASGDPDWRVLSARGTILAEAGEHKQAEKYFVAALRKNPRAESVKSNLALSYALDGQAGRAEPLLRQAVAEGYDNKRVRQNLALVLGLQGKFGEAKQVAEVDLNDKQATTDVAYLRSMVSVDKAHKLARDSAPAAAPTQVAETDTRVASPLPIRPPVRPKPASGTRSKGGEPRAPQPSREAVASASQVQRAPLPVVKANWQAK